VRLLKPLFLAVLMLFPWLMEGQNNVPTPQIGLSGNIGCIGFPCVNSGTYNMTSDANVTLPITSTATSAFYLKVTSSVALTATRKLIYPAGQFPVGIENATTGGQSLSICGPSGTCIVIANSTTTYTPVWNDGTNFVAGGTPNAVTGTGTTGTIPDWTGNGTLGNSPLSVASGNVFNSGNLFGQELCWHYVPGSGSVFQASCLTYAGHGNFYGPYTTTDGSTYTPTAFSVGQLQVSNGGGTGGQGILFWNGDTNNSGSTNLVGFNGYATAPTGNCPNIGGLFSNPIWALGADETLSYCTNSTSSTWQNFGASSTLTGDVLKSSGSSATTIAAIEGTPVSKMQTAVHVGDSITWGYESTAGPFTGYPSWLDNTFRIPTANRTNNGVVGASSFSQDPEVIQSLFYYVPSQLVTEQIGTNNLPAGTGSNNPLQYGASIASHILWFMTPPAQKILFGTSSGVTFTGTWSAGAFVGKVATVSGSTASFSVTGPYLHIVTYAIASSTAAATYSCDGGAETGSLNFILSDAALGAGMQDNPATLGGSATTVHACVITATTAGSGSTAKVDIEFISSLTGNSVTQSPIMLEGEIPDQNPAETVNSPTYRAEQQTIVTEMQSQGLSNLSFVTTAGAVPANAYSDSLHMTNLGYWYLGQTYIAALNTALASAFTEAPFTPGGVSLIADQCSGTSGQSICAGFGSGNLLTGSDDAIYGDFAMANATSVTSAAAFGWSAGGGCTTNCGNSLFLGAASGSGANIPDSVGAGFGTLLHVASGGSVVAVGYLNTSTATSASNGVSVGALGGSASTSSIFVPNSTDTNYVLVGTSAGKSTSSILTTDWGALGFQATVANDFSWELGTGNNTLAHSIAFRGHYFADDTGDVISFTGGAVSSIIPTYSINLRPANYLVGDVLTLQETGSSNDATVTVGAVQNGVPDTSTSGTAGSGYGNSVTSTYTFSCVSGACTGSGEVVSFFAFAGSNGCSFTASGIAFNIITQGSGYTAGDTYTLAGSPGSGCQFTIADVRNGVPSAVSITSAGHNFNTGNVASVGGSGTGQNQFKITAITPKAGNFCFGSTSGDCITDIGTGPKLPSLKLGSSTPTMASIQGTDTALMSAGTVAASQPIVCTDANGGTTTIGCGAYAPLASPALTGTPTAPTATVGTNTTQVATTAFVLANAGGSNVIISPTVVSCTTSGSVTVTGTKISTYDTEILILLNSCTGGMTITYPAFTHVPSLFAPYEDGTAIPCVGANVSAISTTSASIIFQGSGSCAPGPSSNAIYTIKGW
jgi:hypothetical protein